LLPVSVNNIAIFVSVNDPYTLIDVPGKSAGLLLKGKGPEYTNGIETNPAGRETYITAIDDHHDLKDAAPRESVADKLNWADHEVDMALNQAMTVLNDKKTFLLGKLKMLRQKREDEQQDRDKNKMKTPIQVLKTHRVSPSHSDSDGETDSVFVRKRVIKTDKRKIELKYLANIDDIVSKAEKISLAVRQMKYMTPFLEAKVVADVDSDEETPDLVDVMSVTIGQKIVVLTTDFKNSCLKAFSHLPDEVSSSVIEFDSSPWGIAKLDEDTVAVTIPLKNKMCLVDVSSGLKLKDTVKTKKQYYGLVAIGSSVLVGTSPYSQPRSVDVFDLSGTVLQTLVIDALLQQPSFVCTTPSGSFVISDLSKGMLLTVSRSLEVESGFQLDNEAHLESSRGVAANADGDIFVVDYRQKKVKIFSCRGQFLKDFLTSDDGLKYPYGVCFDDKGRIYVTDGGVIKIFSY